MKCPVCEGTGSRYLICYTCNGSGEGVADRTICKACKGEGELNEVCPTCKGLEEITIKEKE